MSDKIIAKRYAAALIKAAEGGELEKMAKLLGETTALYTNRKFIEIIKSPLIASKEKSDLILSALSDKPQKLVNLVMVLAEKGRLLTLPAVAEELRSVIAAQKQCYGGLVHAAKPLAKKQLDDLAATLSKRLGTKIELDQSEKSYEGVKVSIGDLGLEVDFSKTQIRSQILGHILRGL